MSFRDLIVIGVVLLALPGSYRIPFTGLLTFSWLAYMRAQDLCWGFARTARLSYLVAATMLVGFFAHEFMRRRFTIWDLRTRCMVFLAIVIGIGLIGARQFDEYVQGRYLEFLKIILIALFTAGQISSKNRMRLMVWTIAISLGFYGVKNGIFGILTAGRPIIRGPGGMLEDNNDFALAMVMNIPLLLFMGQSDGRKLVVRATQVATFLTAITVFCTYSRGAFLSMMTVFGLFVMRSRYKALAIGLALVGGLLFWAFAPEALLERYSTITDHEDDASAQSRLTTWGVALRMAMHYPWLGVGLRNYRANFGDFHAVGVHDRVHEVHNSYLQVWAEGGSIAFAIYLVMLFSSFVTLRRLIRRTKSIPGSEWIRTYAMMFEASLAGFCVGATFLNRGHFDLAYHILSLVTALNVIALAWFRLPEAERPELEDGEEREPLRVVGGSGDPHPTPRPRPSWSR